MGPTYLPMHRHASTETQSVNRNFQPVCVKVLYIHTKRRENEVAIWASTQDLRVSIFFLAKNEPFFLDSERKSAFMWSSSPFLPEPSGNAKIMATCGGNVCIVCCSCSADSENTFIRRWWRTVSSGRSKMMMMEKAKATTVHIAVRSFVHAIESGQKLNNLSLAMCRWLCSAYATKRRTIEWDRWNETANMHRAARCTCSVRRCLSSARIHLSYECCHPMQSQSIIFSRQIADASADIALNSHEIIFMKAILRVYRI